MNRARYQVSEVRMREDGNGHILIPSCTTGNLKAARKVVQVMLGVPRLIGGMLESKQNGIEVWQRGGLRGLIETQRDYEDD